MIGQRQPHFTTVVPYSVALPCGMWPFNLIKVLLIPQKAPLLYLKNTDIKDKIMYCILKGNWTLLMSRECLLIQHHEMHLTPEGVKKILMVMHFSFCCSFVFILHCFFKIPCFTAWEGGASHWLMQ